MFDDTHKIIHQGEILHPCEYYQLIGCVLSSGGSKGWGGGAFFPIFCFVISGAGATTGFDIL